MLKTAFKNELFKNISWQWFSVSITASFGFIQSVIIARHFGVYEFGLFALAMGITTLTMQLVDIRYLDVLVKYLTEFRKNKTGNTCLSLIFLSVFYAASIFSFIFFLYFIFGDVIQAFMFSEEDYSSVKVLLIICLTNVFINLHLYPIFQSVFRVYELVRELSILTIFLYTARLCIVMVLLWHYGFELVHLLLGLLLVNILFLFIYGFIAIRTLLLDVSSVFFYKKAFLILKSNELRKFIKNIYFTSVFSIPSKELDINILGLMADPAHIGVYRVAKNFYAVVWAFVDPVVLILYADFTRKYVAKEYKGIILLIRKVSLIAFISSVVMIFFAFAGFEHVLNYSVGNEFQDAKTLFCIMLAGSIIWASFVWIYPVLLLLGETQIIFKTTLISGILSACLFFLLTFYYDVNGTAVAYSLAPVIASILQIIGLRNCSSFLPIRQCYYS